MFFKSIKLLSPIPSSYTLHRMSHGGVAVIAGAGEGIGSAIARKCSKEGMLVCVVRRNKDKLEGLVESIEEQGGKCQAFSCDIRKEDQVNQLIDDIETRLGPIELAVHNVGANIGYVPVKDTTPRKYSKVWEMAAFSAFLFGKEVGGRMEERQRGTLIFTGATASVRGSAGHCAFSGAMMAKRALAQSLARELGPRGVHVAHVLVDGMVDNPNTRALFGNMPQFDELEEKGGMLKPDDVAQNYWNIYMQPRSAWTHEMDIRPWVEKW